MHIPFCSRRCDYCAFATWTDRHHLMEAYAGACGTEAVRSSLPPASSVFFGGGTPSLLPADLLVSILDAVPRRAGAEVTVECNPETVRPDLLDRYLEAGVTRISLGVQSMDPTVLAALGRDHRPGAVVTAVEHVRDAGFASFNLDLIYGGAGETVESWAGTVDAALALDPPHVSAYALTVEPGTPLAGDVARHPADDDQADKYAVVDAALGRAGLSNYEISNWARAGHECRHNVLYWSQGEYRGLGCAAHSHLAGRRWWNIRTPERYIAAISDGRSPEAAGETLSAAEREIERLQLGLRTRDGVPEAAFPPSELAELQEAGLVSVSGGRVRLTGRGRLLASDVAVRLGAPIRA